MHARTRLGTVIFVALLSTGLSAPTASADRPACLINLRDDAPAIDCPGGIVMALRVTTDREGRLLITAVKGDDSTFGTGAYTLRVFDPDQGQRCTAINVEHGTIFVNASQNRREIEFPPVEPALECVAGQKVRKGYCVTKAAGGNPAHFCSKAAVVSAELVE